MTYQCKSVAGGWQTEVKRTGKLIGPVFNSTPDLWDWQRDYLKDFEALLKVDIATLAIFDYALRNQRNTLQSQLLQAKERGAVDPHDQVLLRDLEARHKLVQQAIKDCDA